MDKEENQSRANKKKKGERQTNENSKKEAQNVEYCMRQCTGGAESKRDWERLLSH